MADELSISHGYITQIVLDKGCPKLVPDLVAGRLHLFSDDTAEKWLRDYRAWREDEPARKAAKRAETAARARAEIDAETARNAAAQKVSEALQDALKRDIAEEAARVQRAQGGVY
ncbi:MULTISPECIES: hypothetical protein [unclassified Variovorax]|nr:MULTISPECIES: hypothetical protein [unclassified Variovorax]RSZ47728.1 hypothetical protein EJO70_03775 [Variovorax sp. 553]RSZ48145.1 hypothetical protein EJO71_00210 [Variovorax sp. 679]